MAGSRPDSLRASVVITCCGEAAAKRVRKVVKTMKWLRDLDVPCAVVVDTIYLFYSQQLQQDGHLTPIIEAQLPPNPTTLCGRRIRKKSLPDSQGAFCTLGGLILVEGFAFGITVEHAFHGGFEDSGLRIADEDALESGADSSYGDDEISRSPFVSFDRESNVDTSENSFQSQHEPARLPYVDATDQRRDNPTPHSSEEYDEGMVYRRIGKALPSIGRDGLTTQCSYDWTLIDIDDPSCFFPNKIKLPGQTEPKVIEDVVPEGLQAEGHVDVVLVGGGVSSGRLTSSPTLFKVGDLVMDTRLIIMDDKLGKHVYGLPDAIFMLTECYFTAYGDSGAWVLRDGKLCGHIIGGKGYLPWAYMVPIHQIMREIKLAFGTNDVCLPRNMNEFRIRMPWQEPDSETKVDPDGDEKGLIVSPTQSTRTINDLNKKVTDSDALSPQIQQDSLIYPEPTLSTHPYKMILSKIKEESESVSTTASISPPPNALRSTVVDDTNAASLPCDTLAGQHDLESCIPSAQIESKPIASQPTVSQTGGSQHRPAADTADEIKTPSMFMPGSSPGDDGSSSGDNESSVKGGRPCEAKQTTLANIQKNKHLSRSKSPSFEEIVQPRHIEEVGCGDKDGVTALHRAAANEHNAVVQLLLEGGAGVEDKGKYGETTLHGAAASGYEAVVRLLLENGVSVGDKNEYGETALHGAAASGHEAVVRLLLKNGASVDDTSKYGDTALHGAAASGHEAVVRLLLENGAGIDGKNEYAETALHRAAANGHEAVVRLLLENGASVDDQSKYGGTALHGAATCGNEAVVRLLLEYGAGVDETALNWAAASEHEAVVRLLLEYGVDETALHGAAPRGQKSTTASAFLKRRRTAQNMAHLQKYTDVKPSVSHMPAEALGWPGWPVPWPGRG
jgi:ankyrin repeat protein